MEKKQSKIKYYGKKVTTSAQDKMIQELVDEGFNVRGVINKNDSKGMKEGFKAVLKSLNNKRGKKS
tara:strand:+ start:156 stop:353 length:198 start_codon:yes stop_codon:yes gene_type:complete